MNLMTKNFFIHIGNHKTGTTAIQTFLNYNSEKLKLEDIQYTKIGFTEQYPYNNHNIAWELNGDIRFSPKDKKLDDLYNFISNCKSNIIISSEDFQNLEFDSIKFDKFKNEIKKNNFNIKIILYLRNQIDYFAGIYQIMLLLGYPIKNIENIYYKLEKDDFIKLELPLKVRIWFDYNKQIDHIKKIFDIENKDIICKSYDENKNRLLKSFLDIINVSNKDIEYDKFVGVNESITALSVTMLEFFNQKREKFDLSNKDTLRIKSLLTNKEIFSGEKFKIKDKNLKSFMIKRFKDSNNLVEKKFNILINQFLD